MECDKSPTFNSVFCGLVSRSKQSSHVIFGKETKISVSKTVFTREKPDKTSREEFPHVGYVDVMLLACYYYSSCAPLNIAPASAIFQSWWQQDETRERERDCDFHMLEWAGNKYIFFPSLCLPLHYQQQTKFSIKSEVVLQ